MRSKRIDDHELMEHLKTWPEIERGRRGEEYHGVAPWDAVVDNLRAPTRKRMDWKRLARQLGVTVEYVRVLQSQIRTRVLEEKRLEREAKDRERAAGVGRPPLKRPKEPEVAEERNEEIKLRTIDMVDLTPAERRRELAQLALGAMNENVRVAAIAKLEDMDSRRGATVGPGAPLTSEERIEALRQLMACCSLDEIGEALRLAHGGDGEAEANTEGVVSELRVGGEDSQLPAALPPGEVEARPEGGGEAGGAAGSEDGADRAPVDFPDRPVADAGGVVTDDEVASVANEEAAVVEAPAEVLEEAVLEAGAEGGAT